MDAAITRCRETGVVAMTLANAHHIGRVGAYGELASGAGLVSLHFVNVTDHRATVAPFRGTDARFVTNPVCIAVPGTERHPPLLLDMATSAVAMGKIRVAKNEGKPAPEGALIDAKGKPTRDPNVMYSEPHGALLPFGGHKGYALAVMTELLATALTGGPSIQPGNQRMGGVQSCPSWFRESRSGSRRPSALEAASRSTPRPGPRSSPPPSRSGRRAPSSRTAR
jgi:uncharacterized oxidoreductase